MTDCMAVSMNTSSLRAGVISTYHALSILFLHSCNFDSITRLVPERGVPGAQSLLPAPFLLWAVAFDRPRRDFWKHAARPTHAPLFGTRALPGAPFQPGYP